MLAYELVWKRRAQVVHSPVVSAFTGLALKTSLFICADLVSSRSLWAPGPDMKPSIRRRGDDGGRRLHHGRLRYLGRHGIQRALFFLSVNSIGYVDLNLAYRPSPSLPAPFRSPRAPGRASVRRAFSPLA